MMESAQLLNTPNSELRPARRPCELIPVVHRVGENRVSEGQPMVFRFLPRSAWERGQFRIPRLPVGFGGRCGWPVFRYNDEIPVQELALE